MCRDRRPEPRLSELMRERMGRYVGYPSGPSGTLPAGWAAGRAAPCSAPETLRAFGPGAPWAMPSGRFSSGPPRRSFLP